VFDHVIAALIHGTSYFSALSVWWRDDD
jgi:hypothetical protein